MAVDERPGSALYDEPGVAERHRQPYEVVSVPTRITQLARLRHQIDTGRIAAKDTIAA